MDSYRGLAKFRKPTNPQFKQEVQTMLTVAQKLTEDQLEDLYCPKAKNLKPGDVIYGVVTDYPRTDKIMAVIKLTAVSHRGDKVRLFGKRLTSNQVGREWSSTWIFEDLRYEIPF